MKNLVLYCFIALLSSSAMAQTQQFSFLLGGSYYIGDLNKKHFDKNTNLALGLSYKKNHKNLRYAYRLHFMYGKIEAYDYQSDYAWERNRNLDFKSTVLELGAILEVNFVKYKPGSLTKKYQTPFLFFGIAGYNFKPKGMYNGKWYDLQALGTEGQNTSANTADYYKLNQIAFPVGFGYKKNLTEKLSFSIEYGARILVTDYLDDVSRNYVNPSTLANESGVLTPILADKSTSQLGDRNIGVNRGNSPARDWYFFTAFSISWNVGKKQECDTSFEEK
jgi:hypothetical protein